MSFILDALRKSENDRQRQASPNVSVATVGPKRRWQPGWIALALTGVGAALLAVTVVWWFLTPPGTPTNKVTTVEVSQSSVAATENTPDVRSLAQEARRDSSEAPTKTTSRSAPLADSPAAPAAAKPAPRGDVPLTITEAMANGLSLPILNLDIHVFAPQPDERFVFINARNNREREQLREGPTVKEITSDGVILEFQGSRLLLPRD